MNKQFIKKLQEYSPIIIVEIFIVTIFYVPGLLYFSGFFAIGVLLTALKKWEAKKVLLILSPIITYPLFLYFTRAVTDSNDILNLPFHWLQNLTIYIAIYAGIYGFVFKDLWTWLAESKRRLVIGALEIIAVVTLFYGSLAATCHVVSNAEKGVTREEVLTCRQFNLYHPTGARLSGDFSGLPYMFIKIPAQGVGFTIIAVVLSLMFFEQKNHRKGKKKNKG